MFIIPSEANIGEFKMLINGKEYISTAQAGKILNVTQQRVGQMATKEGKLAYHRIGETGWLNVCKKDVEVLANMIASCSEEDNEEVYYNPRLSYRYQDEKKDKR